jgi:cytosine/adenosine deaminase-related metal-dependent hydrolase
MAFETAQADRSRASNHSLPHQASPLRLCGARVAVDACYAIPADVQIERGYVKAICANNKSAHSVSLPNCHGFAVDLSGYLLLPGLINAHDHLEFSLFPKLGRGPYCNAEHWAQDIYHPESSPISELLKVPKWVRLWWGGINNLLAGVTTACHHNEFCADVFDHDFPVRILRNYAWSHSLAFGRDLDLAFHSSCSETPYIIHAGEGTDATATAEILELDRRRLLDARTVIVHGVALDDTGHELLIERGAGLIWCPGSNLFTLGATLSPQRIERNPRIALGSDSALTAGKLLTELRLARELGCTAEQVFDLVTIRAADVLRLRQGEGLLRAGAVADVIAVPDIGLSPAETLVLATMKQIEVVLLAGEPRLLSEHALSRFPLQAHRTLEMVTLAGVRRYVRAPVGRLVHEAKKQLGGGIRLADQEVF